MIDFKQAKDLFLQYKGEIIETEKEISIVNTNTLIDYWGKSHKVECKIQIVYRNPGFSVWSDEKTCAILGGGGRGCETMEEAIRVAKAQLEKYFFEKRNVEQTSLF